MATATPTKNTVPTSAETPFGVARCKLLAKYPLYRYREQDGENHYRLSVLLIGSVKNILNKEGKPVANHLKELLGEFLANGQLLDTSLSVTVLSETAEAEGREFCDGARNLHRFIEIKGVNPKEPNEFAVEWKQGSLEFQPGRPEDAAALAARYRYVFISTGDNDRNQRIAENCSCRGVLAFTQDDDIQVCLPKSEVLSKNGENDAFMEQIYSIAHNLYFVYAKSHDVRETRAAIRNGFDSDDYNRLSDLEAALHVRSKLACCGITDPDLKKAAAQFAEKIRDENLLEDLAELEHRRWCISKMMQGYVCPPDVSGIYRNGNTTHSKTEKWHTILVPYSGDDLLNLDEQTGRIQKRCGELTSENQTAVDSLMDELQILAMRNADALRDVLPDVTGIRWAVEQLWQGKRSVVPMYKRHMRDLQKAAKQHEENIPDLKELLEKLSHPVEAQIECVTQKDYKELNRILVRQIPFALTHKVECVLVKPLADRDLDCLFSPWRLEPTTVHYVDVVESQEELRTVANRVERLNRFLEHNNNGIARRYHILHPADVKLNQDEVKDQFKGTPLHLEEIKSSQKLEDVLTEILDAAHPDYIDLTGGNPMLTCAARQYAECRGIGAFYVRGGRLHDICNAAELEYEGPEMDITVQEMFDKAGASLIKTDSRRMSAGAGFYQTFWDIALRNRDQWDAFCKKIETAYQKTEEEKYVLAKHIRGSMVPMSVTLAEAAGELLIPILMELCEKGYLDNCDVRRSPGTYEVDYRIRTQEEGEKLRKVLERLANGYQEGIAYDVRFSDVRKNPHITSRSLRVDNMEIPTGQKTVFTGFLDALEDKGLIRDKKYDSTQTHCSFRAASADVRDILLNSGKVLEAYIYYSAMLDGRFDDVEMSVFFHHSKKQGAAKNEVDVICTRGISSLFISAKNVRDDSIDTGFLNHVCYEVSVLADQFGINAKRVLVAPDVEHFDGKERSRKVRQALSRNVYLVGDALCKGDKLGKVLKKIAAGDVDWDKV